MPPARVPTRKVRRRNRLRSTAGVAVKLRVQGERQQQHDCRDEDRCDHRRAQDRAAQILDAELQQAEPDPHHQEAEEIEWSGPLVPDLFDEAQREHAAQQAERDVDVEDPAPRGIGGEKPAHQRPHHRTDQRRKAHIEHRRHELAARKAAQQDEAADRRHHRAAQALQTARNHQLGQVLHQAAQGGAGREHQQRQHEDPARAEAIGKPAAHRNEHGQRQDVSRDGEVHPQHGGVEIRRHPRDRRRDDGGIEMLHQECGRDGQRDQQPQARIALGWKRRLGRGLL